MWATLFLYVTAIVWAGYGIYCFLQPQMLGEIAGVAASNVTGATELRAMYGGAQFGIGVMAFFGARELRLQRPTLLGLACIYGGLGISRAVAALLGHDATAYTLGAGTFEILSLLICVALLRRIER